MATTDNNHWAALKNRATQTADLLQQLLDSSQADDIPASSKLFASYADLWQQTASEAYKYGLHGLYDVCTLYYEAVLEVSQQLQCLDDNYAKLLQEWQERFLAYLDTPDMEGCRNELILHLQDALWINPLPDDDIEILKNLLIPETIDFSVDLPDATTTPEAVESVLLETDKKPEADSDDNHWAALKKTATQADELLQKAALHSQAEDTPAFTKTFASYAEKWQTIAGDAYNYGLHGLYDVCMLYFEAVLDVSHQIQNLDDNHINLLEQWQQLFTAYLDTPELGSCRNGLLQNLQEPLWTNPLPDDDIEILKKLLLPETIGFSVEIEDEQPEPQAESIEATEPTDEIETDFEQATNDSSNTNETQAIDIGPELVTLIQAEFKPFAEALVIALDSKASKTLDPEQFNQAIDKQTDELEMLARVSETIQLAGLKQVFDFLHNNMDAIFSGDRVSIKQEHSLLKKAVKLILKYLDKLDNSAAGAVLAKHLKNAKWLQPLSETEAESLVNLFSTINLLTEEEAREPQKTATAEDISLYVPEDVNQDLFDALLNELPTLTSDFTEAVQLILRNGDMQDVEKAQRIAHTLKGSANLVGIIGIATLTHHIEEIMEKIAEHGSMPKHVLDNVLMDCADCLESMSDSLLGKGDTPENALSVLQQVLNWTYRISVEGIPDSIETAGTSAITETKPEPIDKAFEARSKPRAGNETMTRVPSSLVEDMLRMAGENSILTGQIQQRLSETISQNKSAGEQNTWLLDLILELEQLVDVQGVASNNNDTKLNDDFDPLEMDQYNELHTCSHRLMEVATDTREMGSTIDSQLAGLKDLLLVQERLQKENHELVLRTRMVPVQTVVPRFQRAIRQAFRVTGKEVKLNVIGADTMVDRDILNSLIDSVMHLLRNSADHGIEAAKQRKAAGKPEIGNISLEFGRKGNRIVVICQDDGGGLDLTRIRESAEKKNLITEDQVLTEQELQRLILMPGFSTRDSATQVSGRGIGMDAVNAQVIKMKGELLIDSQLGEGCRVELILPDTLVSLRAVLVRCGEQLIAISNRGLEQILYPGAGKLQEMGDEQVYQLGEKIYAADKLESILNLPASEDSGIESSPSALLIKMESGESKTILVDHVVDSRELVVKNMGQYVPEITGIAGATILGDGSVTPVLDIPELLRNSLGQSTTQMQGRSEQMDPNIKLPTALVVDDSLSARRSLAQLLKDTGLIVDTAIDGVDAIDKIDAKRPDIILVDLEMPRMNGIELSSYVRKRADIKNIPIIMVTSRATDKHRKQAESAGVNVYLTKPFSEDELMGHVNQKVGAA